MASPAHRSPALGPALVAVLLAVVLILGGIALRVEAGLFGGSAAEAMEALSYLGLFLGIVAFLVAHGLWNVQPWARRAAVALSCLALLLFPQGTIMGIVLLWFLYRPEVQDLFRRNARLPEA